MAEETTTTTQTTGTTQTTAAAGDGDRRTKNEIIAELAAERVGSRRLAEELAQTKRTLEETTAGAEAKTRTTVETEVGKVGAKLTKMQQRLVDAEVRGKANELGLADPDLLMHPLLDRTKIVVDDEGNVSGVAEAFEALKTKKPDWFKKPAAASGGTGGGSGATAGATTTTTTGGATPGQAAGGTSGASVKGMTDEQYRSFKSDLFRNLRAAR